MIQPTLPRLYAIVDSDVLKQRGVRLRKFAVGLRAAGVSLVQYRDKIGTPQETLKAAATLREVFAETDCMLIMNDRSDLSVLASFDGVHVGQADLSPDDAKTVVRGTITHPSQNREGWATQVDGIVGVSTHTDEQVRAADLTCADYIAIGPVFSTSSKADADEPVGLEGVRRARALTQKPLVAIGGITRDNARSVIDAGAGSVAVISALFADGESVEKVARDFLELLR